jgi:chemotaxis protein CheD
MPEECLSVGIAEYKIAAAPLRLGAYGLGSCVGAALWDPEKKVGGLAHIMLPSSSLSSNEPLRGKFADTAIEGLLEELEKAGCGKSRLIAKLVGGANMFSWAFAGAVPIGLRNVSAAREKLGAAGIPILAEEVGGDRGRTVYFYPQNGSLEIRKLNQPSLWI